jgi:hypothetical protein
MRLAIRQVAACRQTMILEGIVTTIASDGLVNIAPMGPRVDSPNEFVRFVLRPYRTSTTYCNLKECGEGVLHVTDDVWLLARAAIGSVDPFPPLFAAHVVRGQVLAEACHWYEFRVVQLDDSTDRTTIECEIVHRGRLRDFFGFNRAKHAVVEAAILATRTEFLPIHDILNEFRRLSVAVEKTAGAAERRAFEFLLDYVNRVAETRAATESPCN